MRRRARWVATLAVLTAAIAMPAAHAEPPANDDFVDAHTIQILSRTVDVTRTVTVDMRDATVESGEPTPCMTSVARTAWLRVPPPVTDADGPGLGVQIEAYHHDRLIGAPGVAVYVGDSVTHLTLIACGDPVHLGGAFSQANWTKLVVWQPPGTTFFVQISEAAGEVQVGGEYRDDIRIGPSVSADDRRSPRTISPTAVLVPTSAGHANVGLSSRPPDDPQPSCAAGSVNLWDQLLAARTTTLEVTARAPYLSTPAYLAVYRVAGGSFDEVACVPISNVDTIFALPVVAGEDYRLEVGLNPRNPGDGGSFDLTVGPLD